MEDDASTSPARLVRETPAATVLLDPQRRRFLEPFMRGERSASQAAREVGVSVKDMAYRVKRFVALGLLDMVREQPRGGRPIRFYRASVAYFVPFASLPEADLVEMVEALVAPWQALALRGLVRTMLSAEEGMLDWGWLLRLRDRGVSVGPAPGPTAGPEAMERLMLEGAVPVFYGWIPLRLTRERARELQRALVDVVREFGEDDGPEPHLLGLALAPLEEDA
jgi:hypothetical protein